MTDSIPDFPERAGGQMAEPVLRVRDLCVEYRVDHTTLQALHEIDLAVRPGEVLGIVGESGCGKSTLSAAVLGLLPANGRITAGQVLLGQQNLVDLPESERRPLRGAGIGMVFQDPLTSLNPTFTVGTQMVNAQRAHASGRKQPQAELRARAVRMLERVGIPDPELRVDDYPHEFSGGQRQRIMIATVLLLQPTVLICDEATSALDVTLQAQVLDLLRHLCLEEGTALIVISHDIGVIAEMADRVCVLYAGRVVEAGSMRAVLDTPGHPYTRRLIASVPSRHRRDQRLVSIEGRVPSLHALPPGCTFAPRCPAAAPECAAAEPGFTDTDGHPVRCLTQVRDAAGSAAAEQASTNGVDAGPASNDDLMRLDDLVCEFADRPSLFERLSRRAPATVRAVNGVDLTVRRGEILGLVGESGSGKTTLGKALLGLTPVSAGAIRFDGQDLVDLSSPGWRGLRRRLQMIFQEAAGSLSPRQRVSQLVTEPYRIHGTPRSEQRSITELLDLVGLTPDQAGKFPHQLSGGQARRVVVARALAVSPDFIVADEPTAGLDVSAAANVLNLLVDLRNKLGLSLLVITHDLNLVGYVANRIAVMRQGQIVEFGGVEDVLERPRHDYTHQLLASVPDLRPATHGVA